MYMMHNSWRWWWWDWDFRLYGIYVIEFIFMRCNRIHIHEMNIDFFFLFWGTRLWYKDFFFLMGEMLDCWWLGWVKALKQELQFSCDWRESCAKPSLTMLLGRSNLEKNFKYSSVCFFSAKMLLKWMVVSWWNALFDKTNTDYTFTKKKKYIYIYILSKKIMKSLQ